MPVVTLTVFEVCYKEIGEEKSCSEIRIWHAEIHGLQIESDVFKLIQEIPSFHRKGDTNVLTLEFKKETYDYLIHSSQYHPAMSQLTSILNALDGIGYKVVGNTTLPNNRDNRNTLFWTLAK